MTTTPSRSRFVWADKEGKEYRLDEIDDRYLGNIISLLKRRLKELPDYEDKPGVGIVDTLQEEEELFATIELLEKEQKCRKHKRRRNDCI